MSLHDAYARITPFELAFRDRARAEALVEAVREEAEGRGTDPGEPHAFVTMGAVAAFIDELEGPDAEPGAVHQYGALAFHGAHFTRAGFPLYLLTTHVARYLVDGTPGSRAEPPAPAGYLQLPQHLFWTETGVGAPESIDGIFWSVASRGLLHSLLVSGLRPDRPGVGVVSVPEAPVAESERWLDVDARGDGSDFSSTLPGGELDRLYSLTTSGEVLKLLARFFAYVHSVPGVLHAADGASSPGGAEPGTPRPSALAFTRVELDA